MDEGRSTLASSAAAREIAAVEASSGSGMRHLILRTLAIFTCGFYLYAALFGQFPFQIQRGVLLGVSLAAVFLLFPSFAGRQKTLLWLDLFLAAISAAAVLFVVVRYDSIVSAGELDQSGLLVGTLLILLVLEATRRAVGLALPIVTLVLVAYAYWGNWMPLLLSHRGIPAEYIVYYTATSTEGIWGPMLAAMSNVVIYFIIFAAFYRAIGGGDMLIAVARSMLGHVRGGPAKIAVIGSSIFGTISGSVIANVVATGSITIPLMKRTGFKREFAGAVEAVASTGGQIMPPVMGTVAFLMADFLGVPYTEILIAAIFPALLYYLALMIMVDLEAAKGGFKGLPRSELPSLSSVMRDGWPMLIPIGVLIYVLAVELRSPMRAAFWALVSVCAIYVVRAILQRMALSAVRESAGLTVEACEASLRDLAGVVAAVACAGITIGLVNVTGLGFNLSSAIVGFSGGNLLIVLVLTMLASLILGMGLPVVGVYLILAVLVAPALIQLGVAPIGAHLFVFYFGLMSGLTPPVAIAAYVAAGIAGGNPMKTGYVACRLAFPGLLLPFFFVYHPELLLQGDDVRAITAILISATAGMGLLAVAVQGYAFAPIGVFPRLLLAAAGLSLLYPGLLTDFAGLAVGLTLLALNWRARSKITGP